MGSKGGANNSRILRKMEHCWRQRRSRAGDPGTAAGQESGALETTAAVATIYCHSRSVLPAVRDNKKTAMEVLEGLEHI